MEITRVDFTKLFDSRTLILKYSRNWQIGEAPKEVYKSGVSFEEILDWFRSHDWDVCEWKIGARAFKNGRRPVRHSGGIKRKRREVRSNMRYYNDRGVNNTTSLNLAFYL